MLVVGIVGVRARVVVVIGVVVVLGVVGSVDVVADDVFVGVVGSFVGSFVVVFEFGVVVGSRDERGA